MAPVSALSDTGALCYYIDMFITPHTSAAIWISTKVTDPVLAFAFGLISHFILDIIPHGDEDIGSHKKTKRGRFIYMMKVATVDVILSVVLVYFYITRHQDYNRPAMAGAIVGAWLPDVAWIVIENFKMTALYWYIVWHGRIHNAFNWRYSPVYGVPFQIIVTLLILKVSY
ncbi:hypothetical protein C4566_02380 [Candidatus Parcubacteria bacterium]|nr:MAG: hypothetical protein C4566_02380 [Candidatus Parcubacteria bacterium]